MHYHYFTIEQREALKQLISSRMAEQPALKSALGSALERLHTPDYGVCEGCGADIPFTRLYADPALRLCGRCHG
jgi:RNA polymerase-binding transcription factor DksA